jgi:hypothetical protein
VPEVAAILIPLATLAIGVWCGIRIERHRRDRNLDDLLDR